MKDFFLDQSLSDNDGYSSCADIVLSVSGVQCVEGIDLVAQQTKKLLETVGPHVLSIPYGSPFRMFIGQKNLQRGDILAVYLMEAIDFLRKTQLSVVGKPLDEIIKVMSDLRFVKLTPKQTEFYFTIIVGTGTTADISYKVGG